MRRYSANATGMLQTSWETRMRPSWAARWRTVNHRVRRWAETGSPRRVAGGQRRATMVRSRSLSAWNLITRSSNGVSRATFHTLVKTRRQRISRISEVFPLLLLRPEILVKLGLIRQIIRQIICNGAVYVLKGGPGREALKNRLRRKPLSGIPE